VVKYLGTVGCSRRRWRYPPAVERTGNLRTRAPLPHAPRTELKTTESPACEKSAAPSPCRCRSWTRYAVRRARGAYCAVGATTRPSAVRARHDHVLGRFASASGGQVIGSTANGRAAPAALQDVAGETCTYAKFRSMLSSLLQPLASTSTTFASPNRREMSSCR